MAGTVHLGAVVSAVRPLIQATLALKAPPSRAGTARVAPPSRSTCWTGVEAGALDAGDRRCASPAAARPALAWTRAVRRADGAAGAAQQRARQPAHAAAAPSLHPLRPQPAHRPAGRAHAAASCAPSRRSSWSSTRIESIVDLVRSGLGVAICRSCATAAGRPTRLRVHRAAAGRRRGRSRWCRPAKQRPAPPAWTRVQCARSALLLQNCRQLGAQGGRTTPTLAGHEKQN